MAAEINIILQILATRLQYVDAFLGKTQGHLSRITEAQATMLRIRDTPVPLPYLIILQIATWLFVFTTPFLYQTGTYILNCCHNLYLQQVFRTYLKLISQTQQGWKGGIW